VRVIEEGHAFKILWPHFMFYKQLYLHRHFEEFVNTNYL